MFLFDFNWQIQTFLNQFWWPINFLLLIILVILGYLAYKKPVYAIGLTIILLPTYLFRSKIWFLPFTFLELCIWVTFLGWLVKKITTGYRLPVTGYRWPAILLLIASTVSVFIAPDLKTAAGLWKAYFIEPILFFLVLVNVSQTEKDKRFILWSLGISTLSISLLAIFQKFTGFGLGPAFVNPAQRRVTAFFTSPNAVGLYLGPIVVIYLSWLITDIKAKAALVSIKFAAKIIILILALLAIFFTVSQGSWLGLVAAIIFLAYFGWNKKWTAILIFLGLVLVLLIPATRNAAWPVLTFSDQAGQNRLALLQISQQYLSSSVKNFVFGTGLGGFAILQNQLRDPLEIEALLYPHNIFLNFWLEIGLLGLVGFVWLIINFFRTASRRRNYIIAPTTDWLRLGLMAAMVVIIVHGLVDVPYFKNDLAILFWIIISLL